MNTTRLTYSFSLDTHNISLTAGGTEEKFPFVAIITFGGRPSDGLVGGTDTIPGGPYRVDIPTSVLQDKISELVGKPVFASDSLMDHSNTIEIGEFMQAWVEPTQDPATGEFISVAKASGMLFRDRDPDLVDRVISGARNGIMGFSWDIGAVKFNLEEQPDGEKVLKVSDLEWHGATVLRKETAAYQMTHLAASKNEQKEYDNMNEKEIVATIKETIASEFKAHQEDAVKKEDITGITESIDGIKGDIKDLKAKSDEFEKGIKANAEPKGDLKPKEKGEESSEGDTISIKDFAGLMKEAVAEGMKPVTDSIGDLKTAMAGKDPEEGDTSSNGRKSHRSGEVERIFAKYVDSEDLDDGEPHTSEGIKIAIAAVKDKIQNRRQRDEILSVLSAERRALLKLEQQRAVLGIS